VLEAPKKRGEPANAPSQYDLKLPARRSSSDFGADPSLDRGALDRVVHIGAAEASHDFSISKTVQNIPVARSRRRRKRNRSHMGYARRPRPKRPLKGFPERLVTEPAIEVSPDGWMPLSTRIGGSGEPSAPADHSSDQLDVFFPKPFNHDQLEIICRLSKADGLWSKVRPALAKLTRSPT
jgi:hypothetical protein